ncbi:hypothetical protein Cgig2_027642 [Carnegiea gigantea]|uniref:Uncharacterized protein n=1 Tax=Carnegiea gigantea TaxID=171969 RepID=A0A9Q1GW45_9CARY|nr:hypothetical protein Cgig2_027642 [Carnegiea gigantea]
MSVRNEDSRFLLGTPISDERERERERERDASASRRFRTLLHLLSSDKSDDGHGDGDDDRSSGRRRAVKERVGFTLTGCCGCPTWPRRGSPSPSPSPPPPENNNEVVVSIELQENGNAPGGMNLAEALAAEREFRLPAAAETPERVSLMRLLEMAERERQEEEEEEEEEEVDVGGNDRVCCVCMTLAVTMFSSEWPQSKVEWVRLWLGMELTGFVSQ